VSRGAFITLEGIEGAGKSTVAQWLGQWLGEHGLTVRLTREPGGTELAERVRRIVLERGQEQVSAQAETLLMFAARAIHLDNLIRPALAAGEWVLSDRFTDATRAYQGGGRGVDLQWIDALAAHVHADLEPSCTLLLDLPVPLGLQRARARRGETDRFEAETEAFFERIRAAYLALARRESHRFRIIDASSPVAVVREQVAAALAPWLGSRGVSR
jgi:dTMP kinase